MMERLTRPLVCIALLGGAFALHRSFANASAAAATPLGQPASITVQRAESLSPAEKPVSPLRLLAEAKPEAAPTPPPPASSAVDEPLIKRELKLLIPEKSFSKETNGAIRMTFDDIDLLKVLNAEPVPNDVADHLPKWLSDLNGQKIILKGWMFPPPVPAELPAFLFVRDNGICCFQREAKLYDKLGVKMKEGVTTDYIEGHPFDVIGTFVIKPVFRDDQFKLLYQINDATVVDSGK
jgi:hypothetical protein